MLRGALRDICWRCCENLHHVVRLQGPSFFDREAERNALQSYLRTTPTTIQVLLGPRCSGQTALLQEVLSNSVSVNDNEKCRDKADRDAIAGKFLELG